MRVGEDELPDETYDKLFSITSSERRNRINALPENKKAEKKLLLMTEILIRYEAAIYMGLPPKELKFGYNNAGKPYIINSDGYCFSVSHCNDCIVFVSAEEEIGIDIEQDTQPDERLVKRCFSHIEKIFLADAEKESTAFSYIWTAKEAYIKRFGYGLSYIFKKSDTLSAPISDMTAHIRHMNYEISVCMDSICKSTLKVMEISEKYIIENTLGLTVSMK